MNGSRSAWLTLRCGFIAVALPFAHAPLGAAAASGDAPRPNIVLIIGDDQAWTDYGFMGHPDIRTPHLDRLADRSLVFTRGYVTAPLCRPSLASMATGLFPHQHGIAGNDVDGHHNRAALDVPVREAFHAHPTFIKALVQQGYLVHQSGKWWEGSWQDGGFTHGMTHGDPERGGRHGDAGLTIGRQGLEPIREFVDLALAENQPFCLWYAPFLPHTPHNPPDELLATYRTPDRAPDVARYYAMCTWFDATCGALIDLLQQRGVADNTLILFLCDNGWAARSTNAADPHQQSWKGFALRSKSSPYENGIRTPILVSWPGRVAPERSTHLAQAIDLFPTIAAAARLEAPADLPGINLLDEPSRKERNAVFGVCHATHNMTPGDPDATLQYLWCVEGDWKLLLRYHGEDTTDYRNLHAWDTAPVRLFNVTDDPHEHNDVAAVHPDIVERLKTQIENWRHGEAATQADVIVYGSTPGGFCAAIAAAREGASVILLEPTAHVGGLSTGGLSHCDSNQMRRETLMGLFDEWHRRVVKDYTDRGLKAPYNPARKDNARWTFEPHVAMRVTKAMLKEAGVPVLTGQYLKSVAKEGPRITSLVTKNGRFQANVWVDGTYEGDLMAAAGVDWTIGREGRAEFGESLAGKQYPKKTMNISGVDENGDLLPLVTTRDAGPDAAGDQNIMTYSFRLCLTRDPANRVPLPAPAKYDPARFELARRMLKAGIKVGYDLYPLPGGKLDGNNSIHGQLSLGLVGGCNTWHSADEAGRAKMWEEHKQYTLGLLHFLNTDPAVPAKIRDQFSGLGLGKDEFAQTDHFPPALYVRESRRLKGMYVLSQKDIIHSPEKDDAIAISSFPIDSHDCQRVALKDGGVINEGTILPVRVPGTKLGYAYHVPYRSVLPRAAQCTNLLVPVALSSTHVAMSSLRIEGAWMVIGQGAGVAAAQAAKRGVPVQDLPYPILRERLLAQGQVLKLPAPPTPAPANEAGHGR